MTQKNKHTASNNLLCEHARHISDLYNINCKTRLKVEAF